MTNLENIQQIIEYIELHLLDEKLDLDTLSKVNGYSKYHLHRLFSSIVNIPIHTYVQRRRLTLAAHMLVFTDKPIIEIALSCGYETQQSFTRSFETMYKHSPNHYRKHKTFMPIQLPYEHSLLHQSAQNLILDIQIINEDQLLLAGFEGNTKNGFRVIGKMLASDA